MPNFNTSDIEIKLEENDEDDSFTYKALIKCPVSICSEIIQIKKFTKTAKSGNTIQAQWVYTNFRRHLTNKHIEKQASLEPSTSKSTQPSILNYVTKDIGKDIQIIRRHSDKDHINICSEDDETEIRSVPHKRKAHMIDDEHEDEIGNLESANNSGEFLAGITKRQ